MDWEAWEDKEDKLRKQRKRRYMHMDGRSVFLLQELANKRGPHPPRLRRNDHKT